MYPRGTPGPDRLSRYGGLLTDACRGSTPDGTKGLARPDRAWPGAAVSASVRHLSPSALDQQAHPERWRT